MNAGKVDTLLMMDLGSELEGANFSYPRHADGTVTPSSTLVVRVPSAWMLRSYRTASRKFSVVSFIMTPNNAPVDTQGCTLLMTFCTQDMLKVEGKLHMIFLRYLAYL